MKGKIIALAVSFAFCFAAIFFSVNPTAYSGRGSGKDAAISTPSELAEIIAAFPTARQYSSSASLDTVRSATLHDITKNTVSTEYHTETTSVNRTVKQKTLLDRDMYVSYTPDAAYYDVTATLYNYNYDTTYYKGDGGIDDVTSVATATATLTELEMQVYIGTAGMFVKYDKYETVEETTNYDNDKIVEDEEEPSLDTKVRTKCFENVRSYYGRWIDVNYALESSDETSDEIEMLVKQGCVMLGGVLASTIINVNDSNIQMLNQIGKSLAQADDKDNPSFKSAGGIYVMTAEGIVAFMQAIGWNPEMSTTPDANPLDNYNVKNSSFVADLTDATNPRLDLKTKFQNYISDNAGNASSYILETEETVIVSNVDNTVVPAAPSAISMYDFMGKLLKELIEEEYN